MIERHTVERKVNIFKALANKTLIEAGLEYGFDKIYKDKAAIRNAVHKIFRDITANPEKFGVSTDLALSIKNTVKGRSVEPNFVPLYYKEDQKPIGQADIKELTTSGRNKAMKLLHAKMDELEAHPRKLAKENIVSIAKVAGILFDKAQIINGEATEHVAILSKVDDNMKPEDAMQALLKMREGMMEEKFA